MAPPRKSCLWTPDPFDIVGSNCPNCLHSDVLHLSMEGCVMCRIEILAEKIEVLAKNRVSD